MEAACSQNSEQVVVEVVEGMKFRVVVVVPLDMDIADGKEAVAEEAVDLLGDHNAENLTHIHHDDNWNFGAFGCNFEGMK